MTPWFLLGMFLFADAPKPPVIPDQLKAEFWKSRSLMQEAQAELDRATALNTKATGDLQKFCGDGYQVQLDGQKDLRCVAKIPVVDKPSVPSQMPATSPADKNGSASRKQALASQC